MADALLYYYRSFGLENDSFRMMVLASPFSAIFLFYLFISSTTSNMISFTAFIASIVFMGISVWMLVEILKKDSGPKAMQDIAEVIREGSEGFFVTQYGTIFKYAFLTSFGLFIMYACREIPAQSNLNNFFTPLSMALITTVSF